MSKQTFPTWMDQPGSLFHTFRITGAGVNAVTAGAGGLDGRGKFLCTILSNGTNRYTINWTPAFGDVPYVFFQPSAGQNDTIVQIVSSTSSQLVIDTVLASTNAPASAANLDVYVVSYNTTSFMS
jgi:hypothetical protein